MLHISQHASEQSNFRVLFSKNNRVGVTEDDDGDSVRWRQINRSGEILKGSAERKSPCNSC